MKKQNILFLEQFGNHIGGGQIILLGILEYLQKTNQWNIFVSLPEEGKFTDLLREKGFKCIITSTIKHSSQSFFLVDILHYTFTSTHNALKLLDIVQQYNIQTIYCNGGRTFMSSILLSLYCRVPIFWHIHLILEKRQKSMVTIFGRSKRVKQLIAVSETVKETFKDHSIYNKITVIPNWVQPEFLMKPNVIRTPRSGKKLQAAVIGQISFEKGQSTLLNTLLDLDTPLPIELTIAGESKPDDVNHSKRFYTQISQLNKKGWNIRAIGFQNNIPELLDKMDILLIPSLVPESFGLTAIEAMAREVIVIANDVGALHEIIENEVNGFLYNALRPDSLITILQRLLNKAVDYQALRRSGLQTVTEKFAPDKQITKIHALLTRPVDKRISILQLNGRSDIGGGPQNMYRLLNEIDKTNFRFLIACPKDPPFYPLLEDISEISVFPINLRKLKWHNLFQLIKLVKEHKVQIVHSQGKAAGLWSRLLKLFFPKLIVLHQFHGIHYKHYKKKIQPLYKLFESLFSLLTTKLIFVSESELQEAKSVFHFNPKKALVINNGVQTNINSPNDKHQLRSTLNLPQDSFIGISISRYSYQKNIHATLEIIEKLKFLDIPLHFVLLGGEDDIPKTEILLEVERRGIADMITLAGETMDVFPWLFASDFYLSTARWEGLPLSILEAMSVGLPVIASNVVGNDSLVSKSTGYLIPENDLDQFRDAIISLHADNSLRRELGKNGKTFIESNYSIQMMVEKHEKFYSSLLPSK